MAPSDIREKRRREPSDKMIKMHRKLINKDSIYNELKHNVELNYEAANQSTGSVLGEDEKFETYKLAASLSECETKVRNISDRIDRMKEGKNEHRCILGIELLNMKFLLMDNKCDICKENNDMYAVVECKKCTANSMNDMQPFRELAMQLTKNTLDYINFSIRIGRLCHDYPKFKYSTISLHKLKKHMSYLKERMLEDYQFWEL